MRIIPYPMAVAGSLLLAGCQTTGSTQWMKYGPGPDYDYAKAKCEIAAMGVEKDSFAFGSAGFVFASQLGDAIDNEIRKAQFTDRCMVLHGWKKVQVQPGAPAVQPPPTVAPADASKLGGRPGFDPGRPPSRLVSG